VVLAAVAWLRRLSPPRAERERMNVPSDVIPDELNALLDDLQRRGYLVTETRYDEASFGNAIIVLKHDATRIRLVRDRGQWFIEVAAAHDWFDPMIWRAFLEASEPSVEIIPLAVQAQWLLEDLGQIEVMSGLTQEQLAALDDLRTRRFAARMALPLDG
jgi:hypothetical protein